MVVRWCQGAKVLTWWSAILPSRADVTRCQRMILHNYKRSGSAVSIGSTKSKHFISRLSKHNSQHKRKLTPDVYGLQSLMLAVQESWRSGWSRSLGRNLGGFLCYHDYYPPCCIIGLQLNHPPLALTNHGLCAMFNNWAVKGRSHWTHYI